MTKTIRLFLCTMILLVATATSAFASYQTYLGGDSNYILVDAHMDTGWYVDKSSLNVQMYNPPQYIIAINVCTVPNASRGNTSISKVQTMRFFYNYDLRKMSIDRHTGSSDWRYLDPNGCWAETGISMPAGEKAFELAYGMEFYHLH